MYINFTCDFTLYVHSLDPTYYHLARLSAASSTARQVIQHHINEAKCL